MARYSEAIQIYDLAEKWRQTCLVEGKSLLWRDQAVWSKDNLLGFKRYFTDRPDESDRGFEEKFKEQLAAAPLDVTKLASELVLVYFLFPSSKSVSGARKRELISTIASWQNIQIDKEANELLQRLDVGIGGTGQYYNSRRPFELSYIADVAQEISELSLEKRETLLRDHIAFRKILIDAEGNTTKPSKNILLHLLFPDKYERIASRTHKRLIVEAFGELLDDPASEDLDDRLFAIRTRLTDLKVAPELDFYETPLSECWYVTGDDGDLLSPLEGLSIKKQIVLYGPPGTGKTFEARQLADRIIRQGLLRSWKPKRYFESPELVERTVEARTRRVQFHPGYAYEDFVRGLRLGEGGKTEYSDGVLLRTVEEIKADGADFKEIPFVLILDELNRADLSKVLGECFSLFEDREEPVFLGGQDDRPRKVTLPETLLMVGTMNLIDQSLEQIDFALRRRFLWFFRGFDPKQFLEVCRTRCQKLPDKHRLNREWDRFAVEFETLADRAAMMNAAISKYSTLGPQYEIGHTYFCDVVSYVVKDLIESPRRQMVLFDRKGNGRDTTVGALWKYSLGPLLEQYLSGIDGEERQAFIGKLRDALVRGTAT